MNAPAVDISVSDQVRSVRARSTTVTELVTRVRTAIEAREPELEAWVQLSSSASAEAAGIDNDQRDLP